MSQRLPDPSRPANAPYTLELLRMNKEGESCYIRTLSEQISGLAYHWIKGKGEWCKPNACLPEWHKYQRNWKGYFAGERWDEHRKLWLPMCIEVTESMELDMRERFTRGQVWYIERNPPPKPKKWEPVTAKWIEDVTDNLGPAFDFRPTVMSVYHAEVTFGVKPWLPGRVIVEPTAGLPPGPLAPKELAGGPITDAQWAEARRVMGTPTVERLRAANRNGKN